MALQNVAVARRLDPKLDEKFQVEEIMMLLNLFLKEVGFTIPHEKHGQSMVVFPIKC